MHPKRKRAWNPDGHMRLPSGRVQHHWTLAPKCQSEISICLDTRWLFGCCGRHEPKEPGWQHPSQQHAKSVLPAPRPSLCGPRNRMRRRRPRDRLPGCFRHGSAAPASPRPRCRRVPTVPLGGRGRQSVKSARRLQPPRITLQRQQKSSRAAAGRHTMLASDANPPRTQPV